MANDFGYEPWARANVKAGQAVTLEQCAELLVSLDAVRRENERLRARIAGVRVLCDGPKLQDTATILHVLGKD